MKYLIPLFLVGCAHLTTQDQSELAQYVAQQDACILAHKDSKAQIDACRAQVKRSWCAKWAARFDAGVCE